MKATVGLLAAALAMAGCTDSRGRPDPAGTALLGAAAGAAVGYGVGQANQPRYREPSYAYSNQRPAYYGRSDYYRRDPYAQRGYYYR